MYDVHAVCFLLLFISNSKKGKLNLKTQQQLCMKTTNSEEIQMAKQGKLS